MFVVTGGAGFIGSAIVWMLNCRGIDDIVVVDSLGSDPYKWKNLRGLNFTDVWTPSVFLQKIEKSVLPDVHTILHMGASSSTTEQDADHLLENNHRYSQIVGKWAVENNRRFIYASSAAIYGDGSLGFSDDPAILRLMRPLNMYGYSKQLFDLYVLRQGWEQHAVGLRFFNIFGPNEYHKGPMRSMVLKAVEQIKTTGKVGLFRSTEPRFGDGDQLRDFLYVKDAVEMVGQFIDHPKTMGLYNIGSGKTTSWNELARAVFSALGLPECIRYIDMSRDIACQYQSYTLADMKLFEAALGRPIKSRAFPEAVRDYVNGYLQGDSPTNLNQQSNACQTRENINELFKD